MQLFEQNLYLKECYSPFYFPSDDVARQYLIDRQARQLPVVQAGVIASWNYDANITDENLSVLVRTISINSFRLKLPYLVSSHCGIIICELL